MAEIEVSNRTIGRKTCALTAGDNLRLKPGTYREPVVIEGAVGREGRPITISPVDGAEKCAVVFTSDISDRRAREWANQVAAKRQNAGNYPTFGHLGDEASLILRNCQYVAIRGLIFQGCWPTGIYLDNCQYVVIDGVCFEGGTIAIGANGVATHDISVQNCHWQQDMSDDHDMWNKVPWGRIHGASDNSNQNVDVDVAYDYRHWDGDFFRGWDVGSNFVFRNNTVSDAFNGIHFFNSVDKLAPGVDANMLRFNGGRHSAKNVLIENNTFVRIRDNVFEPEDHAWNWVIRHNTVVDCYRPFSFEFERAGWFYIYGNKLSFGSRPSGDLSDEDEAKYPQAERRRSVSGFKPKGKQANEGPIQVMFNSWYFDKGKGVMPKFALGRLLHVNNAVQNKLDKKQKPKSDGRYFGNDSTKPSRFLPDVQFERTAERSRFTRRWGDYDIVMDGDVVNDNWFPEGYRSVGYALGGSCLNANPSFTSPTVEDPKATDVALDFTPANSELLGTSIPLTLELPDGKTKPLPAGFNRGAVQPNEAYELLDNLFGFLPSEDWVPESNAGS